MNWVYSQRAKRRLHSMLTWEINFLFYKSERRNEMHMNSKRSKTLLMAGTSASIELYITPRTVEDTQQANPHWQKAASGGGKEILRDRSHVDKAWKDRTRSRPSVAHRPTLLSDKIIINSHLSHLYIFSIEIALKRINADAFDISWEAGTKRCYKLGENQGCFPESAWPGGSLH